MIETKEKFSEEELKRLNPINEEISTLEGRRDAAEARVRECEAELSRVEQAEKAVALGVVAGEAGAVEEDAKLADEHVRASRDLRVARSAVEQAGKGLEELSARLENEERKIHRERHDALARERYKLERKAEKQLDIFLDTIKEIDDLDTEQEIEKLDAGMPQDFTLSHRQLLAIWLGGRIGGSGKLLPGLDGRTNPEHRGPLCEVDPRASKS